MKILFIGDVVGKGARRAIVEILPKLKEEYSIDGVIANVENIAHGKGITRITLQEVLDAGVDFATSGNHVWSKPEVYEMLAEENSHLIRPANFPPGTPGKGEMLITIATKSILVVNLMGRVFMKEDLDCPFRTFDAIMARYAEKRPDAILVDLHGETTSEKNAFGLYLDGRVSAVVGTHTHIPTADSRILPKGTAYITDVGMVGVRDSVIGVQPECIIQNFLTQIPAKHEVAEEGIVVFNSVLITIDESTGLASAIERIQREVSIT